MLLALSREISVFAAGSGIWLPNFPFFGLVYELQNLEAYGVVESLGNSYRNGSGVERRVSSRGNLGSAMNRQAMSFQSGAIKSTSEMIPVGNYFGMHSTGDLVFSGNYSGIISNNPVLSEAGNSSGSSLVLDSVPGLKHDTGLAVEWSVEEQRKLDEGLDK